jgi:hypothetical protein
MQIVQILSPYLALTLSALNPDDWLSHCGLALGCCCHQSKELKIEKEIVS